MEEEGLIGTNFSVDVAVKSDLSKSAKSDNLSDTVDYVAISRIVQEEMAIRSKLIEHVAQRILDRLLSELPTVKESKVVVVKHKAPIQGDVQRVSVEMNAIR
tara:strand:- start:94 stop:399 length:306 start_codon:yes stop_codon:yes gene_type:complete